MSETIASIIKWHEQTFPDATLNAQLEKWKDEEAEFLVDMDPMEFVDMFIVACGIARFSIQEAIPKFAVVFNNISEHSWPMFLSLVNEKMAKNRKRVFIHSGQGYYQHKAGIED